MVAETIMPVGAESVDAAGITGQIADWLREQIDASGARTFVLALSGGIDSAVVCGLCVKAVGAQRLLAVIMPSSSNPDDAVQAAKVAEIFGVRTITVDLTRMAETFYGVMPTEDVVLSGMGSSESDDARQQLATANVRPRLRMTTLYYVANLAGGMVVGTGNKSEARIGYFTKYGDGGVDLFPIIDLYKYEVRAVARHLGIPDSVITRPPSAGLWQGQTDEEEIGVSYEELDATFIAMDNGDTSGVNSTTFDLIQKMVKVSEHKRQTVPSFRRS